MRFLAAVALVLTLCFVGGCDSAPSRPDALGPAEEVVFWHFWGGRDLPVVEDAIARFNASQSRYRVRGVAMPGANLELKLFLAIAGGQPPDVMNYDEPVVAEWAHRGALTPIDQLAGPDEIARLREWLYPAALRIGSYNDRLYALVNGLDVRALYYNKTALREAGLDLIADRGPQTLAELDRLAEAITPAGSSGFDRVGYLPDPRRLWAWGVVFGGRFADTEAGSAAQQITCDSPEVVAALEWMAGYSRRHGADRVAAFRSGDQALTGAAFPLLADRRYAVIMDGQWRVRDLAEAADAAKATGETMDEYGVCPLPPPSGGRERAGWVNGNYFVVPHGANCTDGAWEFMKFWAGLGHEDEAAATAAAGGWIPASPAVVERPEFQRFLDERPLFRQFVDLAASKNQQPTPPLPVSAAYYREVTAAAQDVLYRGAEPDRRLEQAAERTRARLSSASED